MNVPQTATGCDMNVMAMQDALFVGNAVDGGDATGQGGALYVQPTCTGGNYCKTASANVADTSFVGNHAGQVRESLNNSECTCKMMPKLAPALLSEPDDGPICCARREGPCTTMRLIAHLRPCPWSAVQSLRTPPAPPDSEVRQLLPKIQHDLISMRLYAMYDTDGCK